VRKLFCKWFFCGLILGAENISSYLDLQFRVWSPLTYLSLSAKNWRGLLLPKKRIALPSILISVLPLKVLLMCFCITIWPRSTPYCDFNYTQIAIGVQYAYHGCAFYTTKRSYRPPIPGCGLQRCSRSINISLLYLLIFLHPDNPPAIKLVNPVGFTHVLNAYLNDLQRAPGLEITSLLIIFRSVLNC